MLITQFLLENLHFAINLFASLVFFAVSWLYLDAWMETKEHKELFKIIGFALFSLAFLVHATYIEQSVLTNAVFNSSLIEAAANIVKFLDKYLALNVDYQPLLEQAAQFEEKLKSLLLKNQKITNEQDKKNLDYLG